jgi:hypothetical protein
MEISNAIHDMQKMQDACRGGRGALPLSGWGTTPQARAGAASAGCMGGIGGVVGKVYLTMKFIFN